MTTTPPPILILGAGVTGLSLAWRLTRLGIPVVLADCQDRPGGVIQSQRVDGYLLERGPNSFTSGPSIMRLLSEVGLTGRAFVAPLRDYQRFVTGRHDADLHLVPTGPKEFLKADVLTVWEKLALFRGLVKRLPDVKNDLTLGDFFRPTIGDAPVDALLRPFLSGVYAADGDRVSLEATFGKLYEAARHERTLLGAFRRMKRESAAPPPAEGEKRPPRALVSFPEGLQELPERLVTRLREEGADVRLGVQATILEASADRVRASVGDQEVEAARLVVAAPCSEAAALLESIAAPFAAWLRTVEYARLTVAHAGLQEAALADQRPGFGFLNATLGGGPKAARPPHCLGMIWNDRIFPNRAPDEHRLFTCFFGGEKEPAKNDWTDEQLRDAVNEDLARLLNGSKPVEVPFFQVTRWQAALPVFRVGHVRRQREALATLPPGVHVLGNYLGGVSMPDRVKAADDLAEQLSRELARKD